MPSVNVNPPEFAAMDRLEAALDLGAGSAKAGALATAATRSLAGAADAAALAWSQTRGVGVPSWAAQLGITWPAAGWLSARMEPKATSWVEVVPPTGGGRQPGSRFLVFQDAATAALVRAGVPRSSALRLLGAFAELADNATDHSGSPVSPFATFKVDADAWEFSVTDFGRGVPASLRTNPKYADLVDHDAVREALKDGVSRFASTERGLGFGVMFRALAEMNCVVRLRTGSVTARWSGQGLGLTSLVYELVGQRAGLHVRVAGKL